MLARDIRRTFLSFYEERGHRVVPSAPLIPNDPTLMFTVAGMVPFKRYLLGEEPPPFPRATSVQKCFRTENIEDVGTNAKDCTLFEMLGNFSFGDYWKAEACSWAWELMTQVFKLDIGRLWVTVLDSDDETVDVWSRVEGVTPDRIVRFPEEDNFWQMGVAGPCGPSTEIFVDRGPSYGPEAADGPAGSPERYQEIYNLVLMQWVQDVPFHVVGDLPQTGIDTGMGLERIAQILQDVPTVWDTDEIAPLVAKASEITGAKYLGSPAEDRLLQIVTDHSRSATFLIADGVAPSNEGRGYILRRVLRRALTEARLSGHTGELLPPMAQKTIEVFGSTYPELERNREGVLETLRREEQRFSQTLDAGLGMLEEAVKESKKDGKLPGEVAFRLHDTYGFPLDITRDVASREGLEVDEESFERLMEEQKTRSRAVTEGEKARAVSQVRLDVAPTTFLGYDQLDATGKVVAIVKGNEPAASASAGEEVGIVFESTPFYPEGGGQVGDRGTVVSGDAQGEVLDTQSIGAAVLHTVRVTDGEIHLDQEMELHVDPSQRMGAEQAHTATHMLHHTLRNVLGEHVRQMGSLVEPGRLRFDFSHFSAVHPESLEEIEETVNSRVASDDAVRAFETSYQEAIDRYNAMAFFEEKYGDEVRVVEIGDYSYELCGGTHVPHTGRVGFVKLLGEGSIGSNIRRVEALTGVEGLKWVNSRLREAERAAELVKVGSDDLVSGIERLLKTQKELEKRLEAQQRSGVSAAVDELIPKARDVGRGKLIVERRDQDMSVLGDLAAAVRDKLGPSIVVLGAAADGRAGIAAATSKSLGIDAREVLRPAAVQIGGNAGGKPLLARGGGPQAGSLDQALAVAAREAENALA
jgi:alanyl-tRNA synthetase